MPVSRALERPHRADREALETAAARLGDFVSRDTETDGVREVSHEQDVRDRFSMRVADADRDLQAEQAGYLGLAPEAIHAEVHSEAARERLHEAVPASRVAASELGAGAPAEDHQPGRLALFDRETVLLSALQEGLVPGERAEIGLPEIGVGHRLVVRLRSLVKWRRRRQSFRTA